MANNLVFMSIRDLGGLIGTRQVSPTELTELFLRRLEDLGSNYNAVVTVTHERALQQAHRAEQEITAGNYRSACMVSHMEQKTCYPHQVVYPLLGGPLR